MATRILKRIGQLVRSRPLLVGLITNIALFSVWPQIDQWVASLLIGPEGFLLAYHPVLFGLREGLKVLWAAIPITLVLAVVTRLLLGKSWRNRNGRSLIALLAVLIIGPGVIVNLGFKEYWGRARPYQTVLAGRDQPFTPVLRPASACETNCSFPSGDVAIATFTLCFSWLLHGRRQRIMRGVSYTLILVTACQRLAVGAHFLSDVIFAFLLTLIVARAGWWILDYSYHSQRKGTAR